MAKAFLLDIEEQQESLWHLNLIWNQKVDIFFNKYDIEKLFMSRNVQTLYEVSHICIKLLP